MENKTVFQLFCALDFAFLVLFCTSSILLYSDFVLLIVIVGGVLLSFYPLYAFLKESQDETFHKAKLWYLKHHGLIMYYFTSRLFLLFIYFTVVIIEKANIDVYYTLRHIDTTNIVLLCVMGAVICGLFLFSLYIHYHHSAVLETIIDRSTPVTASVYMNDRPLRTDHYPSFSSFDLQAANEIYLMPGKVGSGNHARMITNERRF